MISKSPTMRFYLRALNACQTTCVVRFFFKVCDSVGIAIAENISLAHEFPAVHWMFVGRLCPGRLMKALLSKFSL